MLFALCLLACTSNDPMNAWHLAAPSDQQPVAPGSVTNLPGCATVTVEVSGSNKVTAHFPADSACKTGLVLIPGGAPTYDRPNTGRVTLPVRVLNRSGAGVLSPAHVYLGTDAAAIVFAPGLALKGKKGVTPLTPDSATNAGAVWLVGTPGITGAADSTGARPLTFTWSDGVQQVKLSFTALAAVADTARPIPPDTMAWPMTGAPLLRSPDDSAVIYYRNLVSVEFGDTVSGVTIRSLLAKYGAIIVGGYLADPSGSKGYVLRVPDPDSSMSALDALRGRLQAEPGVELVGLNTFRAPVLVRGRFPVDSGLAGHRASWPRIATAEPTDTGRPVLPDSFAYPTDSLHLVQDPIDTVLIYMRRYALIGFRTSANGLQVRSVLSRWGATIVGGMPSSGSYVVTLPDTATTWVSFLGRMKAIERDSAVAFTYPIAWRAGAPVTFGLHPDERKGIRPGASRTNDDAPPADTSRPEIIDSIPSLADSAHLVSNPSDTVRRYLRRFLGIRFNDTTSGVGVRAVLASLRARIVGGSSFVGEYLLQVPDLGPDYAAFARRIHTLERDPRVDYVVPYLARDAQPVLDGRFPPRYPGLGDVNRRGDGARSAASRSTPGDSRKLDAVPVPPADTGRPGVPTDRRLPGDTSAVVIDPASPQYRYYRTIVGIQFKPAATGSIVRSVLARFHATIIGAMKYTNVDSVYLVRIPDPGDSYTTFAALLARMRAEVSVTLVLPLAVNDFVLPRRH